jgi:hypothetical protein
MMNDKFLGEVIDVPIRTVTEVYGTTFSNQVGDCFGMNPLAMKESLDVAKYRLRD